MLTEGEHSAAATPPTGGTPQAATPPGAGTPQTATPPAERHAEPNYMGVFAGLTVLTVAEVLVAFVSQLPKTVLIVALLGLALWKALLVALYYMHLKFEPRRLWLVALTPLPLALLLVAAVLMERF